VKPERIALMPNWPARMGEDMACLYMGVSMTTFRERVKTKTYPQPVREGGRLLWAKRQLDLYVDAQFGIANDEQGEPDTWADLK
jgi:predicted DNA-binding transcriptional regulator AlpA